MADYLQSLVTVLAAALQFKPDVVQTTLQSPYSQAVTVGVLVLSAVSTLVGESIVLMVNRVKKSRFLISLSVNALFFLLNIWLWASIIWATGRIAFDTTTSLNLTLRLVTVSSAPLIFGFLILMPYAGTLIGRVLNVWRFLVVLRAVEFTFGISSLPALLCVGLGWLAMLVVNNTLGRPLKKARQQLWRGLNDATLNRRLRYVLPADSYKRWLDWTDHHP